MQKVRISKRDIKKRYNHIVQIGYCNAQFLLTYEDAFAYSARVEGWACDYYDVDGVLISTGYDPLDDKNAKHDYNLLREYEVRAREIVYGNKELEDQKEEVSTLLREYIAKVIK